MNILGLDLSNDEEKSLIKLSDKSPALTKVLIFLGGLQDKRTLFQTLVIYENKLLDIANAVGGATFDMQDKDDKSFERTVKAMGETIDIVKTIDFLKNSLSPEEEKEYKSKQTYANVVSNWASERVKKS